MFFHDCYNVWMLRANEQTKPVSKLIKSELWKKTVCSVRVMGTWKKSDAQSLPSGKAKLYNYFFTPSGQVEKYKTSSSKEKESASRLARCRWGVEGYSQRQNVAGVRKAWYFLTVCNKLWKSDVLGERRRMSIQQKVTLSLSSAEHWKLRCTLPNPPTPSLSRLTQDWTSDGNPGMFSNVSDRCLKTITCTANMWNVSDRAS